MYRLFCVLISLYCCQAFAFDAKSLYQAAVPVSNQTEEERQRLIPDVLQKVLLKVVGNSAVLSSHDLTPLLSQSSQYVKQFQYQRVNQISDDLTQPDSLELLVSFDQQNLNRALTAAGLPIWHITRPQILVWLVYSDGQQGHLLGNEHIDYPVYQALLSAADARGLPVMTPMMDLQDQRDISAQDIAQRNIEKIKNASLRYGNRVVVVANVKQQANTAAIDWHWLINDQLQPFQTNNELKLAVEEGIDQLSNQLSTQLSQVVRSRYGIEHQLMIDNVNSYADYSRVMAYLGNLQNVAAVKVASLSDNSLNLSVDVKGDASLFNRTLMFDHVIEEIPAMGDSSLMRYRLLP